MQVSTIRKLATYLGSEVHTTALLGLTAALSEDTESTGRSVDKLGVEVGEGKNLHDTLRRRVRELVPNESQALRDLVSVYAMEI